MADKEKMIRAAWLLYYNRVLRDAQIISEKEYQAMRRLILRKYEKRAG